MWDESDGGLKLIGKLAGHSDWVTQVATLPQHPNMLISSSRDKSLIVWSLEYDSFSYENNPAKVTGVARGTLKGHGYYVSDVALSTDGLYAISGSWDSTLRLWDLTAGKTTQTFVGHTKDVLSVHISCDNRQIVSGARDHSIKLWNTIAECKYTIGPEEGKSKRNIDPNCHKDSVSCVRFSPKVNRPEFVSCGWDKTMKVWSLSNCKMKASDTMHAKSLTAVCVSRDGSVCASGGRDGLAVLWDMTENKHLFTFSAGDPINALCFSPDRSWLCAATDSSIKIWEVGQKHIVTEVDIPGVTGRGKRGKHGRMTPKCLSLCWASSGEVLFGGFSDNIIRVWTINAERIGWVKATETKNTEKKN